MEEVVQTVAQLAAMGRRPIMKRRPINVDEVKKTKIMKSKRYNFFKYIWKKIRRKKIIE